MNAPRNTRTSSPVRSDSSNSSTDSETDSFNSTDQPYLISPDNPLAQQYLTDQVPNLLVSVTEQLENLSIVTMATQLSTADIQRLAEQAAIACHDHGTIIANMGGSIATELAKSLENMALTVNVPAAGSTPKISDLKIPDIATKDGKVDVFSLLSFETDIINLITAIDPESKIEDRRWSTYILGSIKEPAKQQLIGIKPEDYATVKLFLAAVRDKLSGSDVKIVARSKFKNCKMDNRDVNTFMSEARYLQILGWPENDRSEADLINQILIGIPKKWRDAAIRHLGTLPLTFDECRKMILRVQGEESLISSMSSGTMPIKQPNIPLTPAQLQLPQPPQVQQQQLSKEEPMELGHYTNNYRGRFRGRPNRYNQNPRFRGRSPNRGFRGRSFRGRGPPQAPPPRGFSRPGRGRARNKSLIKCWNCDKFGTHMAKECKEPRKDTLYHQQLDWLD